MVVANVLEQDRFVASLMTDFSVASVTDRRDKPSYGYRAIHLIPTISGKPVEIQVRTALQHLWAELSEKSSDVLDPAIKYGGGPEKWLSFLQRSSKSVASYEKFETMVSKAVASSEAAVASHEEFKKAVAKLPKHLAQELRGKLEDSTRNMERLELKE